MVKGSFALTVTVLFGALHLALSGSPDGTNLRKERRNDASEVESGPKRQEMARNGPMHHDRTAPRQIFLCSNDWGNGIETLFPDFDGRVIELTGQSIHQLNQEYDVQETDLILGLLHRAESCVSGGILNFAGKQLFYNPEPEDFMNFTPRSPGISVGQAMKNQFSYSPQSDRAFIIGPHEDGKNSIRVYAGVYYLARSPDEEFQTKINLLADPSQRPRNTKEYFMAYIQSHRVQEREMAVLTLSEAFAALPTPKIIHAGGACQGNPAKPPQKGARHCLPAFGEQAKRIQKFDAHPRKSFYDNDAVLKSYRFTLAFENTNRRGYITEKIFNAFLSGSVPVYWGTEDVFEIFNKDAFIYYDMDHPEKAIARILHLEEHPEEYDAMLRQPILAHGANTVDTFFSLSANVGTGSLRNRILDLMGYSH